MATKTHVSQNETQSILPTNAHQTVMSNQLERSLLNKLQRFTNDNLKNPLSKRYAQY